MNRRQLLGLIAGVPFAAVADCRDERRIPQPDESAVCILLDTKTGYDWKTGEAVTRVARAVFHFGAYEELLRYNKSKKTYTFEFDGKVHGMKVTSLSVDVDRNIGCVVCVVHGRIWSSG